VLDVIPARLKGFPVRVQTTDPIRYNFVNFVQLQNADVLIIVHVGKLKVVNEEQEQKAAIPTVVQAGNDILVSLEHLANAYGPTSVQRGISTDVKPHC
jgi:hypothetical protein